MQTGAETDEEEEQPCFKKPAAKSRPKAKAKAGAKAKAKAKPKGRAKAKAKAGAKPKAQAKAKAKGRPAKKKAMEDDGGIEDNNEAEVVSSPSPVPVDPAAPAAMEDEPEKEQSGKKRQPCASSAGPGKRAKAMLKKVAGQSEDVDHGEGKKTFARRYMPATDLLAKRRWCALKNAFELHIQPGVYFASSLEARGVVLDQKKI